MSDFEKFPKIPRWNREVVVTEKIDGTNAQVLITDTYDLFTGSRKRWITPDDDNFGFARWAQDNADELRDTLGPGRHYGEWWGSGIQRGYDLPKGERRFSLFNVARWDWNQVGDLDGLEVVPVIWRGDMRNLDVDFWLEQMRQHGSCAEPGFMRPEGLVIFHVQGNVPFKVTLQNDDIPKQYAERELLDRGAA